MIIETARFGKIEIDENKIVRFESGLLAFEDFTRFVLFDIAENSDFKWLQSVEDPRISFLLVDPFTIKPDYYVDLPDELAENLGVEAPEDVMIYTTVTVPKGGLQEATTNLVGPLVINWRNQKGKQIICENNAIKYPLVANNYKKLSYGG